MDGMIEEIREVVRRHGRLPVDVGELDPGADLYEAGMTSHASVNVMLGLEETFDIEFPDELLQKSTFQTMAAMSAAVLELSSTVAGPPG
jgi:acyl carrier protein